jgi:hypothetical protein
MRAWISEEFPHLGRWVLLADDTSVIAIDFAEVPEMIKQLQIIQAAIL